MVGERLLATIPRKGTTPELERLVWVRRVYLRLLRFGAPMFALVAVAIAIGMPWLCLYAVVGMGAWLCGFTTVNFQIRRERAGEPGKLGH
jgi:hypothetical protein